MSKKSITALVSIGIIVLIGLFLASSYNSLVSQRETVNKANSKIEIALQRRYDLIPNIVNSTKGYMSHEKEIFTKIADARSKIGSNSKSEKQEGESELSSAISRLLVVQENYPELKADSQVTALMSELEGSENRIATAKTDYNEVATNYNKSISLFPKNIIAQMFGFSKADLIQSDKEAKTAPKVNLERN